MTAGYQRVALPDSDPVCPPVASHHWSSSSDLAQQLGGLHLPTRGPEPRRTRFFPRGKRPAPGYNRVRQEKDVSVLGSSLEGSKLLGQAHIAAWGQLRLELVEPCAHSRWAASEEQRHTCLPHPRPARVRWLCLVLTVWVRDAGGARGRWAMVNRSPPAHSKWLPPIPHLVSQSSCYGLPGRLLWVTQPRKREHAWDGRSLRAAEPRPTGVGAEL